MENRIDVARYNTGRDRLNMLDGAESTGHDMKLRARRDDSGRVVLYATDRGSGWFHRLTGCRFGGASKSERLARTTLDAIAQSPALTAATLAGSNLTVARFFDAARLGKWIESEASPKVETQAPAQVAVPDPHLQGANPDPLLRQNTLASLETALAQSVPPAGQASEPVEAILESTETLRVQSALLIQGEAVIDVPQDPEPGVDSMQAGGGKLASDAANVASDAANLGSGSAQRVLGRGRTPREALEMAGVERKGKKIGEGAFGSVAPITRGVFAGKLLKTVYEIENGERVVSDQFVIRMAGGRLERKSIASALYFDSSRHADFTKRLGVAAPLAYLIEFGPEDVQVLTAADAKRQVKQHLDIDPNASVKVLGYMMDKAPGTELFDVIAQQTLRQRFPTTYRLHHQNIVGDRLASIAVAVSRGFVKRDSKPENAFYDATSSTRGALTEIDIDAWVKLRREPDAELVRSTIGTMGYSHPIAFAHPALLKGVARDVARLLAGGTAYGFETDLHSTAVEALQLEHPNVPIVNLLNANHKKLYHGVRGTTLMTGTGLANELLRQAIRAGRQSGPLERFIRDLKDRDSITSMALSLMDESILNGRRLNEFDPETGTYRNALEKLDQLMSHPSLEHWRTTSPKYQALVAGQMLAPGKPDEPT